MAIASNTDPHAGELAALAAALADDYAVEREIGRGGMGVVYRARDTRLDRLVAVKVLPPNLAGVEDVRERFLREARTAARLAHPNIVPIHRADELGGYPFFVMGLVEGDSLADQLRLRGPLAPDVVLPLLADVARALGYAHARGVVHRDIKPENILIDAASGRAMVTDFGIARLAEASPLTATGQVLGTVYFMSPEQVASDALDGRSDLYSLGVVGFLALSGRYPFDGATASAILVAHVTKTAPPLRTVAPHIPEPVAAIIDRCLMRDAAQRFDDGDALARALDDARTSAAALVTSAGADVLSEREAMSVWHRAAELQALTSAAPAVQPQERVDAARSLSQGYRMDDVRAAAAEAGISAPYVQRAVEELGFAGQVPAWRDAGASLTNPAQAAGSSIEPVKTGRFARALLGGPTRLHLEADIAGQLVEADFELLLRSIRRVMNDAGHMSVFAGTLSWSPSGTDRRMNVTISSRGGRTVVTIDEKLTGLVGACFGGIGGGMGGGGSAGVAALAQRALGSEWIAPAVLAYFALTYGVARTTFSLSARRRERRHRALLDELVAMIRQVASPSNQALPAGPGTQAPQTLR